MPIIELYLRLVNEIAFKFHTQKQGKKHSNLYICGALAKALDLDMSNPKFI